jgi:hypothetical protein
MPNVYVYVSAITWIVDVMTLASIRVQNRGRSAPLINNSQFEVPGPNFTANQILYANVYVIRIHIRIRNVYSMYT